MIDLTAVLDGYRDARRAGEIATLATLIDTEGSTYRRPGARALITSQGDVIGLVSGGCLEKDLIEHARRLSSAAPARLVLYDLRDDFEIDLGLGMGCKGKLTILLERIDPTDLSNPLEMLEQHWGSDDAAAGACAVALDDEILGARLWHIKGRSHPIGIHRPSDREALSRACIEAISAGRSRSLGSPRAFIEHLPPRMSLALFGANPDAVPVVQHAKALGWRVALWDHRPHAVTERSFSPCDERRVVEIPTMARAVADLRAGAALVMTHNYRADLEILRGLAAARTSYVGLLGPRERAGELHAALARDGVHLEALFAPAGLDLGAETPEAIALSIIAEIHAVLHGRLGGSLRCRAGSIHDRTG